MPKKNRTPIATLLREARARLGLSQYKLAQASGVARITIAGLELGKNVGMRTTTAHKLAKALGLPPSAFMETGTALQAQGSVGGPEQLMQQLAALHGSTTDRITAKEAAWLRQVLAQWGDNTSPTVASALLLLLARRAGEKKQKAQP